MIDSQILNTFNSTPLPLSFGRHVVVNNPRKLGRRNLKNMEKRQWHCTASIPKERKKKLSRTNEKENTNYHRSCTESN